MQSRRLLNDLLAKCIAALKTRHPDTSTRLAAIRFIRIIGWKKALPTLLAVARGPSQDPHYLVRASAINALANLGETRAIPFLIKVLNDSNDEVRLAAMLAFLPFAKFKDKSIVAALESKLYGPTMDPRKWLRREAVYILGQLGYGRAPSILKRALRDSDPKIRQLAAAALQKLIRVSPSGFSR